MSSDPHRSSSPQRSSNDARRTGATESSNGIQIRGLARDRQEKRPEGLSSDDRDSYRPPPRDYDSYRYQRPFFRDERRDPYDDRSDSWRPQARDERDDYERRPRPRLSSRSRSNSRSPRRSLRRYHDRDASEYQSSGRQSQTRTSSPPASDQPSYPGAPSKEVIMEGLPQDMLEDDVRQLSSPQTKNPISITSELQAYHIGNTSVRVIRDRSTGKSKQFGFLTFSTIEEAKSFVEINRPAIHLYGTPNGTDNVSTKAIAVKIAFSRPRAEREAPTAEAEWQCINVCRVEEGDEVKADSLSAQPPTSLRGEIAGVVERLVPVSITKPDHGLDGKLLTTIDAAVLAVPIVPVAPVNTGDSDASPDNTPSQYLLFRGLEPTVSEEILARGAAKLLRSDEAPSMDETKASSTSSKITSTSKVANAGARPGCIRRVLLIRDRQTNDSWRYGFVEFTSVEDAQAALAKYLSLDKFTIASKPVIVSYIHTGVFVPYLYPTPETEQLTFSAATNPALKLGYWDNSGYAKVLVVSTGESDKPSTKKSKDDSKPKKRKADSASVSGTEHKPKKQMAPHLEFWTQRGQELRGAAPKDTLPAADASTTSASSAPPTQSYTDPTKHCCYLCSRQFKTAAEANKHERLSELHQTNLKNEETVQKARKKLEQLGLPLVQEQLGYKGSDAADTQEYRDRARERRKAFKTAPASNPGPSKHPNGTTKDDETTSAQEPNEAPRPPQSKAAAMLAKMGHIAGAGLGSGGTGSTAPIETNLYAAGVGLGAQGGKLGDAVEEAGKATRGDYGEFVKGVRERARERYAREG